MIQVGETLHSFPLPLNNFQENPDPEVASITGKTLFEQNHVRSLSAPFPNKEQNAVAESRPESARPGDDCILPHFSTSSQKSTRDDLVHQLARLSLMSSRGPTNMASPTPRSSSPVSVASSLMQVDEDYSGGPLSVVIHRNHQLEQVIRDIKNGENVYELAFIEVTIHDKERDLFCDAIKKCSALQSIVFDRCDIKAGWEAVYELKKLKNVKVIEPALVVREIFYSKKRIPETTFTYPDDSLAFTAAPPKRQSVSFQKGVASADFPDRLLGSDKKIISSLPDYLQPLADQDDIQILYTKGKGLEDSYDS